LFFIPMAVGVSLEATGSPRAAWYVFIVFYLELRPRNLVWWYRRRTLEIRW
jgi:nitrate/nitrite transporter NarK